VKGSSKHTQPEPRSWREGDAPRDYLKVDRGGGCVYDTPKKRNDPKEGEAYKKVVSNRLPQGGQVGLPGGICGATMTADGKRKARSAWRERKAFSARQGKTEGPV